MWVPGNLSWLLLVLLGVCLAASFWTKAWCFEVKIENVY